MVSKNKTLIQVRRGISLFKRNTLFRNSLLLMASTGIVALFGFAFWAVIAHVYRTNQVGLATTVLSVVTLLSMISQLGLNNAIVRYLPRAKSPSRYINTSTLFIVVISTVTAIIFLIFIHTLSPKVSFLRDSMSSFFVFIFFVIMSAVNGVTDGVFIGSRKAQFVFYESFAASIAKLFSVVIFHNLGSLGIIDSNVVSVGMSLLVTYFFFFTRFSYKFELKIRFSLLSRMAVFSGGNYVTNLLIAAPLLILPTIITNKLGAIQAAYFYIAVTITNFIFVIPQSTSQSLFAEGVHDRDNLTPFFVHASKIISRILVPTIIVLLVFSKLVLAIFGRGYAHGSVDILRILLLSSILVSANYLLSTYFKIMDLVWTMTLIYFLGTAFIIVSSGVYAKTINEVGYCWIVGQALICIAQTTVFISRHSRVKNAV